MKKVITFTMLVAIVAMVSPASGAMWDFNEGSGTTVADSSGDGNTGTLQNQTAWTADQGGRTGLAGDYALSFDNASPYDYVSVADDASLDFDTNLTIDLWVKPVVTGSGGGLYKCLVSKAGAYQLKLKYGLSNFHILLYGTSGNLDAKPATGLAANVWSHIVLTYDSSLASGNVKITVNDVQKAQYDWTDTLKNSSSGLTIGSYHSTAEGYEGLIDDVSVTPEPATMVLLGLGGVGLLVRRRRRA